MYFLRIAYRHIQVRALSLLIHKFERVEFLMLLMNVTNKSSNGGILSAGGIPLLTAKELIRQQDCKKQQKILNLKGCLF